MPAHLARLVFAATLTLILSAPTPVRAADDPSVELGTTLVSLVAGLGDNDGAVLGIPSSAFGFGSPGVFASFFLSPKLSVEPQLGLLYNSNGGGRSTHLLTLNGQVNYFVDGISRRSAYVFGSLGVADGSGSANPANLGLGIGYRIPAGGRLTFRLDARFQHFTDGIGNRLGLGISLGGLF